MKVTHGKPVVLYGTVRLVLADQLIITLDRFVTSRRLDFFAGFNEVG